MSDIVVDASAVLALLNREEGFAAVAARIEHTAISAVNWAEVVARLADRGMPAEAIAEVIGQLGVTVVPFDATLAYIAGLMRASTRGQGLSLGDRACLALAQHLNVPALTADQAWQGVQIGVSIQFIR